MKNKSFFTKKIKAALLLTAMILGGLELNTLIASEPSLDALEINKEFSRLLRLIEEDAEPIGNLVPAGSILIHPSTEIPNGFYACDGRAISREENPKLFAAIGTIYGKGDGSSTFNLPDYRGYFLRSLDNGAGRDPDANSRLPRADGVGGDNIGAVQDHEFKSHDHSEYARPGYSRHGGEGYGDNSYALRGNSQTDKSGGAETRPKNITVVYIIKAR